MTNEYEVSREFAREAARKAVESRLGSDWDIITTPTIQAREAAKAQKGSDDDVPFEIKLIKSIDEIFINTRSIIDESENIVGEVLAVMDDTDKRLLRIENILNNLKTDDKHIKRHHIALYRALSSEEKRTVKSNTYSLYKDIMSSINDAKTLLSQRPKYLKIAEQICNFGFGDVKVKYADEIAIIGRASMMAGGTILSAIAADYKTAIAEAVLPQLAIDKFQEGKEELAAYAELFGTSRQALEGKLEGLMEALHDRLEVGALSITKLAVARATRNNKRAACKFAARRGSTAHSKAYEQDIIDLAEYIAVLPFYEQAAVLRRCPELITPMSQIIPTNWDKPVISYNNKTKYASYILATAFNIKISTSGTGLEELEEDLSDTTEQVLWELRESISQLPEPPHWILQRFQ